MWATEPLYSTQDSTSGHPQLVCVVAIYVECDQRPSAAALEQRVSEVAGRDVFRLEKGRAADAGLFRFCVAGEGESAALSVWDRATVSVEESRHRPRRGSRRMRRPETGAQFT